MTVRVIFNGKPVRITRDDFQFQEANVKRDANGQFAKQSSSNIKAAGALGIHPGAIQHQHEGGQGFLHAETGHEPLHKKLTEAGYEVVPGSFKKTSVPGLYHSQQDYLHPAGHAATLSTSHVIGPNGKSSMLKAMFAPHEKVTEHEGKAAAEAEASAKESEIGGFSPEEFAKLPLVDQFKVSSLHLQQMNQLLLSDVYIKAPAPEQIKLENKLDHAQAIFNKAQAALNGGLQSAGLPPAKPAATPQQSAPVTPTLLQHLKPDLETYKHEGNKKYATKLVEKLEAAAGDAAKLQAVHINKMFPKVQAYKTALIAHASNQPLSVSSGPAPAPKPAFSNPAPKSPSGAPVNVHSVSTGVLGSGEQVKALLHLEPSKIPQELVPPPPKSMEQFYAYGAKFKSTLPSAVRAALSSYQASGHGALNKAIAGVEGYSFDENLKQKMHHISKVIMSSAVPSDMVLTRGIHADAVNVIGMHPDDDSVGKAFVHKGFVSASRGHGFPGSTVMKINMPAGAPGLVMPACGTEQEVLLHHHSVFKITKIEKSGGQHVVYCDYVGIQEGHA